MSTDIQAVLKELGGQIADKAKANIASAAAELSPRDLQVIQRAGERKAELLLARLLGQDVAADEAQIDATLSFLASKAAAIVKDTFKNTAMEVVTIAGKVLLKIVFGSIIPVP